MNNRLMRLLVYAIIYHRRRELGVDYDGYFGDWSAASWEDTYPGERALVDDLLAFFTARFLDLERLDSPQSTFLTDAGALAAQIEEPGNIFAQAAKETALAVLGRLLVSFGWEVRDGFFARWQAAFRAVPPEVPGRAAIYAGLLRGNWRFRRGGAAYEDAFQDEGDWAQQTGLEPMFLARLR